MTTFLASAQGFINIGFGTNLDLSGMHVLLYQDTGDNSYGAGIDYNGSTFSGRAYGWEGENELFNYSFTYTNNNYFLDVSQLPQDLSGFTLWVQSGVYGESRHSFATAMSNYGPNLYLDFDPNTPGQLAFVQTPEPSTNAFFFGGVGDAIGSVSTIWSTVKLLAIGILLFIMGRKSVNQVVLKRK